MFGKWLDTHLVSQAEYVRGLGRIVLLAAQHESTIFVGRGAQFILPRDQGLTVRLIAPLEQRIASIMDCEHCNRSHAKRYITDTDRGRHDFVRRYFHHDIADPHLYDLVINLARVEPEEAVELIIHNCRRRFADAVSRSDSTA
jgi:cytidylate kinase